MTLAKTKTRFPRIVPLIASICIQLCLGSVYIWGVFQPYVKDLYGWDTLTASLTFSTVLACFVFGSIVGGRVQDRFNPQVVILGGGIVLGIGIFLASFTDASNPLYLYFTYGFLGGFGMGTTYTTIIACCQKWFPDKRGFATGLVVASLGFGGVIFAPLAELWLSSQGLPSTFRYFAVIFAVVCIIGSFIVKNPPEGYMVSQKATEKNVVKSHDYTASQALKTPAFYAISLALLLATPAYFMITPIFKTIGAERGLSVTAAVSGVMIASLLNSAGRLLAPWISDKFGRKRTIRILMGATIVAILLFIFAQSYFVLVLVGVIAFCYGGYLGIFPTITSDFFGMKNAGVNYGLVLLGFGVAAVFTPFVARMVNPDGTAYAISFIIAAISTVVAIVFTFFINAPKRQDGSGEA